MRRIQVLTDVFTEGNTERESWTWIHFDTKETDPQKIEAEINEAKKSEGLIYKVKVVIITV